jgi:hypothetical protein
LDKLGSYISIVAACFFVLAVAFVWGEILTIDNIAVLGLMDFNDFVSAALLAGSFFLPMVALGLILLLVFGGARYFANWEQACPPVLTMCPIFVAFYTGFYFVTEQWSWGTLFTPALAIIVGYTVWAVIRSLLSRQRNHLVYAWAPAITVAFSAMVAQGWSFTLSQARSTQCVEIFGERRDMAQQFMLALDRGAVLVADREAILYPWNKIDFVWLSDSADLKVSPASRKRCVIVHPTPRGDAT